VKDMTTRTLLQHLDQLAETVADHGVGAVDPDLLRDLATRGLANGASPVLADVLLDPRQPAVARVRAFGRVSMVAAQGDRFVLAA
jgi:hypothetical protein